MPRHLTRRPRPHRRRLESPQPSEETDLADGWGQRDWRNSDLGATLPYLIRRTTGDGLKTFASVFEAHPGRTPSAP